ncbi:MAG TPA: MFS transporter [Candidatus Bathyarchaeia archaeon]|nr:MFS transporter [Candidatus Bathyarchaeia archaeon]
MVLLITTIGAFMSPFDGSVVTIAIPTIASSIKLGLEAAVWIQLAYLLVLTVFLINAGRLADLHGRKRFYTLGFIIFTVGSVFCALSMTDLQLIFFRALQGLGAAFISANSPAIVTDTFLRSERGKALGINTMAVYTGLTVGPVFGGVLVQNYGWRSIFFVNVPIGIVVVALTTLKLKENTPGERGTGFDLPGAVTLSLGLASTLVVLTLGGVFGWVSAPSILLAGLSVVMLFLFLRIERGLVRFPTLDLSLFTRNRLFAAANATAFLSYVAVTGVTLMMAIYLESIRALDPQTAGLFLIAQAVPMALLSPLCGWLSDQFGSRVMSTLGMGIVSVGLLLFSELNAVSSWLDIVLRLIVVGVGFGLFSSPNTSAVMGSVRQEKLGVAAGTLGTMRFMGQSIGLALLGAVMAAALPTQDLLAVFAGLTSGSLAVGEFVMGMKNFFLIAAGIGAIGTLASTTRGQENTSNAGD